MKTKLKSLSVSLLLIILLNSCRTQRVASGAVVTVDSSAVIKVDSSSMKKLFESSLAESSAVTNLTSNEVVVEFYYSRPDSTGEVYVTKEVHRSTAAVAETKINSVVKHELKENSRSSKKVETEVDKLIKTKKIGLWPWAGLILLLSLIIGYYIYKIFKPWKLRV